MRAWGVSENSGVLCGYDRIIQREKSRRGPCGKGGIEINSAGPCSPMEGLWLLLAWGTTAKNWSEEVHEKRLLCGGDGVNIARPIGKLTAVNPVRNNGSP